MVSFSYVVTHPLGLHARPCFAISGAADDYACAVRVSKNGGPAVDASSRLDLVSLEVACGDTLSFACEGPDEGQAAEELAELVAALDADRDE